MCCGIGLHCILVSVLVQGHFKELLCHLVNTCVLLLIIYCGWQFVPRARYPIVHFIYVLIMVNIMLLSGCAHARKIHIVK